jgi:hypothetical protein
MRVSLIFSISLAFFVTAVPAARAQDASPALLAQANCAPVPGSASAPAGVLRVVGGQTQEPRTIFGPHDLIVVGGGAARGVQLGQQFFVRRAHDAGIQKSTGVHAVNTVGGIRIVAVNNSTAIASVDFACEALAVDDFLVPYVEPILPPNAAHTDTSGELDFSAPGHVLFASDDRVTDGAGGFMVADIGANKGAAPGARFAVYRDLGVAGVPLAAVGEAIVVSAGPDTSVVRLTLARDAVGSGDLLVPHRH